ncbi:MAG: hypothetical protein HC846_05305 [Blastocatellia bacterium]|nr:hypothetical protein [Blastocatellia bacterium]
MGFFDKLKGYFGYGILDIELQCPTTIDRHRPIVAGKLLITAKQDEFVEAIQMKISEVWQKKDLNNEPVHKEFQLGIYEFDVQRSVKTGEVLSYNFNIPLTLVKSMDDQMRDKGSLIGALGKMSSMLKSEKSNFWFSTIVHVKSASFEPVKTIEMFLS